MATDVLTIATASAAITASRSPSVTFAGYVPALNDVVVIFPSSTTIAATPTAPSGWVNALGGTTDVETSTAAEICAFYHLVTAGEVSAVTTTYTATNLYGANVTGDVVAAVFSGVDTANVIDATGTTLNSTAVTPHVLPTMLGSALLASSAVISCITKEGTGAYSSTPAGWSLIQTSNTNQGRALARRLIPSSGALQDVAATNITPSASSRYASISLALGATPSGMMVTSGNTGTFSYTVGATDTVLIVGVAVSSSNLANTYTTRTVTYNGVPMTSAGVVNSNNSASGFVELFYLLSPTIGSNTVSVNMTKTAVTNSATIAGAWSYPNVASVGTAVTNFGSSATASVTVPSASTEIVVAAIATGNTAGDVSDRLRFTAQRDLSTGAGNLLIQDQIGEASAVLSANILASDFWCAIGLALKPAAHAGDFFVMF